MTRIYKCLIWFYMLTKRLLHQWSFIILLCLIPCCMLLVNLALSNESGVVHVALCAEDDDKTSSEIIDSLAHGDSIIRFSVCDAPEEATLLVSEYEADAAWIFTEDFSEKVDDYAIDGFAQEPFISIIQREQSIPLKIAQEKLFGAIYKRISFSLYNDFVYNELVGDKIIPEETVESYYKSMQKGDDIIKIEHLNASAIKRDATYLTAPLRGILSLMVVLCTLAAGMYFLKEQSQGKFSWLSPRKRVIPALASCFSAACLSAAAVFVTIYCAGVSSTFGNELAAMLLFVLSVTGFCTTLLTFFRSAGKFGALIPGIIIVMLALSPIFFNIKVLRPIRLMLPTYYYLQSIYMPKYFVYTLVYCVVTYCLGFVLNYFLAERKNGDSIL